MVRVLRYPRLSALACIGAFAAALARDLSFSSSLPGLSGVLLTLTLLLLLAGICLLSCRFVVDYEGVGVGFLFRLRRTAWPDLHTLGTLCCNSRRLYLYGLYRASPDFLHMLHRAPRCGSWGFVVPMSRRLASAISTLSPYEVDLYTGMNHRREKGMRPLRRHAIVYLAINLPLITASLLSAAALFSRALKQEVLFPCMTAALAASLLSAAALVLLYRTISSLQICPHISKSGVSAGRGLYLSWDEVRFGYLHRPGRFSALYLLSAPPDLAARTGGAPIRCLSMPDTSTLVLAYLTYCPSAQRGQY